ncbi:MAG TPA: hypothetical protein VNA20_07115 [Frankiaceae bacterium]|nr:hypothetical protein [Frankiaceae bacterium]
MTVSTAENMSLSISVSGPCVPLGSISLSLSGNGNGVCSNGTGVGRLSFASAAYNASAFAEWTVTTAGVVVDSVIPNPAAANSRVKLVLTNDPTDSITNTRRAFCHETTTTVKSLVTGSITFNAVHAETVPQVRGCDAERPGVGVHLSNPMHEVENAEGRLVKCWVDTEPADAVVGDVAAAGSATATPVAREAVRAVAVGADAGPQCVEGEFFQPKNHKSRDFRGKFVNAIETGNHSATLSYTDTASFTSGVAVQAGFTVEKSVIVAGVKATFNVTLKADWTSSNSRGATVQVPPHSTGWIKYGHMHLFTEGHYFRRYDDCVVQNLGKVEVNGPYVASFKTS